MGPEKRSSEELTTPEMHWVTVSPFRLKGREGQEAEKYLVLQHGVSRISPLYQGLLSFLKAPDIFLTLSPPGNPFIMLLKKDRL